MVFYSPSSLLGPAAYLWDWTVHSYSWKASDCNHRGWKVQVPHIKAPSSQTDESIIKTSKTTWFSFCSPKPGLRGFTLLHIQHIPKAHLPHSSQGSSIQTLAAQSLNRPEIHNSASNNFNNDHISDEPRLGTVGMTCRLMDHFRSTVFIHHLQDQSCILALHKMQEPITSFKCLGDTWWAEGWWSPHYSQASYNHIFSPLRYESAISVTSFFPLWQHKADIY